MSPHDQSGLQGDSVDEGPVDLGEVVEQPLHMGRRGRRGGHVGAARVVTELVRRVLHLHHLQQPPSTLCINITASSSSADHLALGRDEAVAAGHRHGVRGGAAHLLPRAAVIIGEADTVTE